MTFFYGSEQQPTIMLSKAAYLLHPSMTSWIYSKPWWQDLNEQESYVESEINVVPEISWETAKSFLRSSFTATLDFASASNTICICLHEHPLKSTGIKLQDTTDPSMHFCQLSYQLTNYHENWCVLHDIWCCLHCCTVLFPRIHNNMAITLPCLVDTMMIMGNFKMLLGTTN